MVANPAGRVVDVVADGLFFPEGPRWHDGQLYLSDFYDHVVLAFAPDGSRRVVCEVPGRPSGLGFTPAGDLLVVSMTDRRVLRWRDGELVPYADLGERAPFHCNDMLVDRDGRAYVGNFGFDPDSQPLRPTALARVDVDGSVLTAADDLVFPNGMAMTRDGVLLVAETFAFRVSAFDVAPDGGLSARRVWADFGAPVPADIAGVLATDALAPDGIALDAEGALWVADATGTGASRVREGGEVLDRIDLGAIGAVGNLEGLGDLTVFAVAFGGEDLRTLYLCAGPPLGRVDPAAQRRGMLLACRVDVPGVPGA